MNKVEIVQVAGKAACFFVFKFVLNMFLLNFFKINNKRKTVYDLVV